MKTNGQCWFRQVLCFFVRVRVSTSELQSLVLLYCYVTVQ